MSTVQVFAGHQQIVDAAAFITKTRGPMIRVKQGGSPLSTNSQEIESMLMREFPDEARRNLMRSWGYRWLPALQNKDAYVVMKNGLGVTSNAFLDKREWAILDRKIFEMVKVRLNAITDLRSQGLVEQGSLAEMLSQWRMASERVRPSVNMDGRTRAVRDRTERLVFSVPVPIFRTDYEIGNRELLASRTLGLPLDTFEAGEAGFAIAEEMERMLFRGDATIVLQGSAIPGYITLAARDTNTAAGYGGGDFGTISNIEPTFLGMVTALAAVRYHGPFFCYVANTQYVQMLSTYTDGSGQTGLSRALAIPQIQSIKPSDFLPDENVVMVQMTSNVVDWKEAMSLENREWESPDGQALFFAVMAAGAPRLKSDVDGNAGIAHATAA